MNRAPTSPIDFLPLCSALKIQAEGPGQFKQNHSITSFQHGVLESRFTWMFPEASLRAWILAIHAGMTNIGIFIFCGRA